MCLANSPKSQHRIADNYLRKQTILALGESSCSPMIDMHRAARHVIKSQKNSVGLTAADGKD